MNCGRRTLRTAPRAASSPSPPRLPRLLQRPANVLPYMARVSLPGSLRNRWRAPPIPVTLAGMRVGSVRFLTCTGLAHQLRVGALEGKQMLTNPVPEISARTFWVTYCDDCRSILGDFNPDLRDVDLVLSLFCPWCGAERVEVRDATR